VTAILVIRCIAAGVAGGLIAWELTHLDRYFDDDRW